MTKIRIGELKRLIREAIMENAGILLRPKEYQATTDEGFEWLSKLNKSGTVFRGMANPEYRNTVGAGKPILSTMDFSFKHEGTSFTDDALTAESYANSGRSDPRKTGLSTYLIELKVTDTMKRDRDGYIKSVAPVPLSAITRIWEMKLEDGNIVAYQIK